VRAHEEDSLAPDPVMIFRLSQKLNAKIEAGTLTAHPLNENAFADWSAHLFVAGRTQYLLLSNTKSLYSTAMYAKGITTDNRLIDRALEAMREFMEADDQAFIYQRLIAPTCGTVYFAKALDRSVTGSMNDLVYHATVWLTEGGLSPFDVGFKLNGIPFSTLGYATPREVFTAMAAPTGQE